jgi:chromosome segregation ATPase
MADKAPMEERMTRVETHLDGMARDIEVLKADVTVLKADVGVLKADVGVLKADVKELKHDMVGVKQELRAIHHRIDVVVEHVDDGFRRQAELMRSIDERHERRAAEYQRTHELEMQLLRDVLGNHEGRIRGLEEAKGGS